MDDSLPVEELDGKPGQVMVKRGLSSSWEPATEQETRELELHDAMERGEEEQQCQHDEYLYE